MTKLLILLKINNVELFIFISLNIIFLILTYLLSLKLNNLELLTIEKLFNIFRNKTLDLLFIYILTLFISPIN